MTPNVGATGAHLHYRAYIDGLRAVAVLAVLVFHAFPSLMPGGFIGVDVFFVISGYLITGILLKTLQSNTFSLKQFYIRRIRRIFPALCVVLATCFALGWYYLDPWALRELGKHIVAGAGFVANLALWHEVGYFDTGAEQKPLLHLWSLGVEEQFYIVWPLLLAFLWHRKWPLLGSLAVIVTASFLTSLVLTFTAPSAAFYSPFTRAWELGAGSLLACLHFNGHSRRIESKRVIALAPVAGLILIIAGLFLIHRGGHFPGGWALMPVIGACLILLGGEKGVVNQRFLASRPMVWVGLISYPLYLWHWVLLSFAWIEADGAPTVELRLALVGLSVVLAALTYWLIEKPIRFGGLQPWRIGVTAAALAAIAGIGASAYVTGGYANRFAAGTELLKEPNIWTYDYKADARVDECWLGSDDPVDGYAESCLPPENGKPTIFIWGDSHASRFYPGVVKSYGDRFSIGTQTRSSCPPLLTGVPAKCVKNNEKVLEDIAALQPDILIMFANWTVRAQDRIGKERIYNPEKEAALFENLRQTLDSVEEIDAGRVIVMGPAPYWDKTLPQILFGISKETGELPARLNDHLNHEVFARDDRMRAALADEPVDYFSVIDALCANEGCMTYVPGENLQLTTWDYGHLTTPGATVAAQKMDLN